MILQITKKDMKNLKINCDIILKTNEYNKISENAIIGNTYYYANKLGGRIRTTEYFIYEQKEIKKIMYVSYDYEGVLI